MLYTQIMNIAVRKKNYVPDVRPYLGQALDLIANKWLVADLYVLLV